MRDTHFSTCPSCPPIVNMVRGIAFQDMGELDPLLAAQAAKEIIVGALEAQMPVWCADQNAMKGEGAAAVAAESERALIRKQRLIDAGLVCGACGLAAMHETRDLWDPQRHVSLFGRVTWRHDGASIGGKCPASGIHEANFQEEGRS